MKKDTVYSYIRTCSDLVCGTHFPFTARAPPATCNRDHTVHLVLSDLQGMIPPTRAGEGGMVLVDAGVKCISLFQLKCSAMHNAICPVLRQLNSLELVRFACHGKSP
jgi:hypothetical protein